MEKTPPWPRIVIFDGICLLCNHSVDFLMRIDRPGKLKYISSQAAASKEWLPPDLPGKMTGESIIFLDNGRTFTESGAILRIAGHLPYPWKLALVFHIFPAGLRDALYRLIARKRYKWFGQRRDCRMPDEKTKDRMIG